MQSSGRFSTLCPTSRLTIWHDRENLIETFNTTAHVIVFCSENYKSKAYFASTKKGAWQIDWLKQFFVVGESYGHAKTNSAGFRTCC